MRLRFVGLLGLWLAVGWSGGGASATAADLPILFVHGNGDSAQLWETDIWRFESNGYDPSLLFAVDFPHPAARAADDVPEDNRSSTADELADLTKAVDHVLQTTGQSKLVLVGSSRGGYPIRSYIRNGGGRATVSLAILAGVPNHGVFALPIKLTSEFNGDGAFLRGLNQPQETDPGVRFVTLRSDRYDKFAQPTGEFIGFPYIPTLVGYKGPELDGAENVVLRELDHRETAFHALAFRQMYLAVTGHEPQTMEVMPVEHPVLDGMVTGFENGEHTNLPLAGATVEIYAVDPATGLRQGEAVHRRTTGADGRWGPFEASPTAFYEFVVGAAGYPTSHIYHMPFPRSFAQDDLRLEPVPASDEGAGAIVTLYRPRGYIARGRDQFSIDGMVPGEVATGVPAVDTVTARFPAMPSRAVPVLLNSEQMTVRTYPLGDNQVVVAEFTY